MHVVRSFAFALLIVAAQAAEIPRGAHVLLRMVNAISSRTARDGDYVYLTTASPIVAGNRIVVPTGSYVQGVVSHSKRSGHVRGRAELGIRLETLTLPSGQTLHFTPRVNSADSEDSDQKLVGKEGEIQQGKDTGRDAMRVAILAGSGASIGGLTDRSWEGAGIGAGIGGAVGLATVLATRGREVDLRRGATLDVVFDRPVRVD